MLGPVNELDRKTRWDLFFCRWDALCMESGAFLSRLNGRRKSGRPPRWVLILPNRTIEERGGITANYSWDDGERKFFTGWTLEEVLPRANQALDKMLKLRTVRVDNADL